VSALVKILFYCKTFPPEETGYAIAFHSLVNSINKYLKSDYDLVVYTEEKKSLGYFPEIKTIGSKYLPVNNKWMGASNIVRRVITPIAEMLEAYYINRLFKAGGYDVLFVETFDNSWVLNWLPSSVLDRTIVRIHAINETESAFFLNTLYYKRLRYGIHLLCKKIKFIASTNSYHIEFAKKHFLSGNCFDIAKKSYYIIPNCSSMEVNEDIKLPADKKIRFLTLGMMDWRKATQKGFDDLLSALYLTDHSVRDKIAYTIVGSGNMRNYFIDRTKKLSLDINFIEKLSNSEIKELLRNTDVVVLPSRFEGQSMFATEALSQGVAVIFSDTGGMTDMVTTNGFKFSPLNVHELAKKIEEIVNSDSSELLRMKRDSVFLYKSRYSERSVAQDFDRAIRLMVSEID